SGVIASEQIKTRVVNNVRSLLLPLRLVPANNQEGTTWFHPVAVPRATTFTALPRENCTRNAGTVPELDSESHAWKCSLPNSPRSASRARAPWQPHLFATRELPKFWASDFRKDDFPHSPKHNGEQSERRRGTGVTAPMSAHRPMDD